MKKEPDGNNMEKIQEGAERDQRISPFRFKTEPIGLGGLKMK